MKSACGCYTDAAKSGVVWYVYAMQDVQYITGFTAGELSPWLSTRFDLQAYHRGAAKLCNFEVLPYGGIRRRRGTQWVGAAAEQSGAVRLVPFHFSESDALMLELYPGGMRVYREGVLVTGEDAQPYALQTPWDTADEVATLRFTQVNDVVYVTSPHRAPHRLERREDSNWRCVELNPSPFPRETYLLQDTSIRVQMDPNGTYAELKTEYPAPDFSPQMEGNECVLTEVEVPSRTYFMNEAFKVTAIETPDLSTTAVASGTVCKEYDNTTKLYYFYTAYKNYLPTDYNGSKSARDYPDFFLMGALRLTADGQPYEVGHDWEVRTNGEWNAIWELWRSYDSPATALNPARWQWTCIRTLDQTAYSERKNWAISGSESEPCRMLLVCRAASTDQMSAHIFFRVESAMREYKWEITRFIDARTVRAELRSQYCERCTGFTTRRWSFGAFGHRNGFPRFSGVHQGRLWLGGIRGLPTTLFGSTVGDFGNFYVGSADDDALHLSLATDNQSAICWICPARSLLVGTAESEWILSSPDGSPLTATNAAFQRQSSVGSENQPATGVENTVLFVQRGGKRLREISYKLEADGFTTTDTSLLAEHLFRSGVKEWVVCRGSSAHVWVLMADCSVAMLTTNAEHQVTAWQRVEFPGREVLHIASLTSAHAGEQDLWMVVRYINSGVVGIERLTEESAFTDSRTHFTPTADGVYSAPHLAGMQACVVEGETLHAVPVAEDGSFAYAAEAPFCIGVPYRSELHTMPCESERSFNSVRQEGRVRLRLLDSSPAFRYRASCAERWETYDPQREYLHYPYTGSIRISQMPIPGVGQGFCLYVDGAQDFCLQAISIEFDFHGK